MTEVVPRHLPPGLRATYPGSLPFPKSGPLPCCCPLVCYCPLLAPDEPRGAHHCFGHDQVCLEYHPIEHPYHFCQGCMYPDGIALRYSTVVCIENNVVLACCPEKSVVCLLRSADFQQDSPYHCAHYDVEYRWRDRIPLCHPSLCT